ILSARPYTFLDDAPLEERRTQAVINRRWSDPQATDDLGALDAEAIQSVRDEAWPTPANLDEMHEALMSLACIADSEADAHAPWLDWLQALAASGRASHLQISAERGLWVPLERLTCLQAVYPQARWQPPLTPLAGFDETWDSDEALVEVLRARLSAFGPL
ncbi:ATP-dependent DNA helicase, partial [Pseudomonas palleroniana]